MQGVGGPRGLGAIVDAQGGDLYRANGPSFGSAYGTPAVYLGMSQGFGIGVRGYAAGGVGALYDLAGHDRYEAGEFSQAGGYYFGLGILHDVAGRRSLLRQPLRAGVRRAPGVGVLVDDAGDDTYWSMTAASQAGTWDQSIGLLLDKAGQRRLPVRRPRPGGRLDAGARAADRSRRQRPLHAGAAAPSRGRAAATAGGAAWHGIATPFGGLIVRTVVREAGEDDAVRTSGQGQVRVGGELRRGSATLMVASSSGRGPVYEGQHLSAVRVCPDRVSWGGQAEPPAWALLTASAASSSGQWSEAAVGTQAVRTSGQG